VAWPLTSAGAMCERWLAWGQGLPGARVSGGCGSSSRLTICVHPWRTDVPMQSVPVSPPDDHHLLALGRNVVAVLQVAVQEALRVGRQELHRKVDALQLTPRHREVPAHPKKEKEKDTEALVVVTPMPQDQL